MTTPSFPPSPGAFPPPPPQKPRNAGPTKPAPTLNPLLLLTPISSSKWTYAFRRYRPIRTLIFVAVAWWLWKSGAGLWNSLWSNTPTALDPVKQGWGALWKNEALRYPILIGAGLLVAQFQTAGKRRSMERRNYRVARNLRVAERYEPLLLAIRGAGGTKSGREIAKAVRTIQTREDLLHVSGEATRLEKQLTIDLKDKRETGHPLVEETVTEFLLSLQFTTQVLNASSKAIDVLSEKQWDRLCRTISGDLLRCTGQLHEITEDALYGTPPALQITPLEMANFSRARKRRAAILAWVRGI